MNSIDPSRSSNSHALLSFDETGLQQIRRDYLLCKPPQQIRGLGFFANALRRLSSEVSAPVAKRDHKAILDHVKKIHEVSIGHQPNTPGNQEDFHHEPPIQYRIAFVKYIIKQLESLRSNTESAECDKDDGGEDEEEEASGLWYEALEFLSGMEKQTEEFYRLYELPENCGMVKIFENEGAFAAQGTTGIVTWEASIELVRWLCPSGESNEEIKRRKWIVELGCGCGLLATAVLKTFSHLSKYIASDGHSSAVGKCKINLEANFGSLKTDVIQVEEIDWEKEEDGKKFGKLVTNLSEELGPGVMLGADIVFDPSLIPSLVKLIETFLENHKDSIALIACTLRNEETLGVLKRCLESHQFQFKEIYAWGDRNGIIYRITKHVKSEVI